MTDIDEVTPPGKLTPEHNISSFDSRVPQLDDWLKRRALSNDKTGASRTYVVSVRGRVVGYCALANGAIAHSEVTGRVRRNMPEPIPVMVLGRLAIDQAYQGRHLGASLLGEAIIRTLQAADIAGIRALLVHAISEEARKFYERCGFSPSSIDPMTLMLTIADARNMLER